MIYDKRTQFAAAGDFATEAGTSLVGDVIDLGAAGEDVGNGQPVYLVVVITTAADGGAANTGTLAFQLASDAQAAIAVDGTQTIHFTSQPFAAADLPAGRVLVFPLPVGGDAMPYERFLGLQLVQAVEGEDDCVGDAFLTLDPHHWKSYPDAVN